MAESPQPLPPGYVGRLPLALKAGWGVGSMGCLGMLFIVNVFVLFFLVNHLGLEPGMAGLILFITRIYDVISDPTIGYLSDRTSSRWGRRRPWMALGAFVSGLALILVFNVPALASANALAVYELIVLIAYFTGYTLFYVPFMAMPAEMTDDYNERTSIMSWRVGYSNAAGILIAAGMPALIDYLGGDRRAYGIVAILAGALIAATMLMTVLFTSRARELPSSPEDRYSLAEYFQALASNRPFVTLAALKCTLYLATGVNGSALLFFMTYVVERGELGLALSTLAGNIAGLCTVPLWTYFSRGRDKRGVYMVAIVGACLMLMSWALATPEESDLVFVLRSALVGAFGAGSLVIGFSMLPDTIEYDRIRTGTGLVDPHRATAIILHRRAGLCRKNRLCPGHLRCSWASTFPFPARASWKPRWAPWSSPQAQLPPSAMRHAALRQGLDSRSPAGGRAVLADVLPPHRKTTSRGFRKCATVGAAPKRTLSSTSPAALAGRYSSRIVRSSSHSGK